MKFDSTLPIITIHQPHAMLLARRVIDHIDDLPFNSAYRGDVYIHAGVSDLNEIDHYRVKLLLDGKPVPHSLTFASRAIIARATLIDVALMDKSGAVGRQYFRYTFRHANELQWPISVDRGRTGL